MSPLVPLVFAGLARWVAVKCDFAGRPAPAIVVTSRAGERQSVDGFEYVRVHDFGALSVLRRAGGAEPSGAELPAQ